MTTLEEKVKRITQIKRKMTMNNQNIANLIPIQSKARKQLIHTSRMIKKKEKENKKLLKEKEELSEEIKTHLSERIKRPIGQKKMGLTMNCSKILILLIFLSQIQSTHLIKRKREVKYGNI